MRCSGARTVGFLGLGPILVMLTSVFVPCLLKTVNACRGILRTVAVQPLPINGSDLSLSSWCELY